MHGRHTMVEGEKRFCALSWTEELRRPAHGRAGRGAPRAHEPLLALVARRRHLPRPPVALPPPALRAGAQGPHVHAHRRARRRAHHVAARDARRRTQLGLPLLLDARRVLHALGRCTRSASTGRPTTSSSTSPTWSATRTARCRSCTASRARRTSRSRTLDHLSGYEGARPVRIGNGAYSQRQNDVYGAVLDSVYLHSKKRDHIPERLWPVLSDQVECAARVWREPDQGIWEARGEPRHYVSSKLMCWVALDRGARLAERRGDPRTRASWQADRRRDPRGHPRARRGRARRVPPALRHRRARRLHAAGPARPLPAPRRRARARDRARDPRRAHRGRARAALPHRRHRRRPARRGGHVPDLLVLARLGAVGDRRAPRGRAPLRAPARPTPRRSACTPRSSRRPRGATSATTRRRSRTSR